MGSDLPSIDPDIAVIAIDSIGEQFHPSRTLSISITRSCCENIFYTEYITARAATIPYIPSRVGAMRQDIGTVSRRHLAPRPPDPDLTDCNLVRTSRRSKPVLLFASSKFSHATPTPQLPFGLRSSQMAQHPLNKPIEIPDGSMKNRLPKELKELDLSKTQRPTRRRHQHDRNAGYTNRPRTEHW